MEMNELEREIINLAGEIRNEGLPKSAVPATLAILQSGYCHCEERGLRRGNPVLSPLPDGERMKVRGYPVIARRFLPPQSRIPIFATLLLLLLFIPFFSFNPEPALNVVRLFLLLLSIAAGTTLFFKPETMAELDRKILGGRLSRIGPAATRSQEILLFRVQAVYFILIAVFICRL